jgi:hypothetical protein
MPVFETAFTLLAFALMGMRAHALANEAATSPVEDHATVSTGDA